MPNSPSTHHDIIDMAGQGMPGCVCVPGRHNAICGTGDFNRAVVHACAQNGQMPGCAESSQSMPAGSRHCRGPGGQWLLKVAGRPGTGEILDGFCGMVRSQLRELYGMGLLRPGRRTRHRPGGDRHRPGGAQGTPGRRAVHCQEAEDWQVRRGSTDVHAGQLLAFGRRGQQRRSGRVARNGWRRTPMTAQNNFHILHNLSI